MGYRGLAQVAFMVLPPLRGAGEGAQGERCPQQPMLAPGLGWTLQPKGARVVTAGVRAAYAWSMRREEPRALVEVARMLGVVMESRGPGRGPSTPTELVAALQQPLGALLPPSLTAPDPAGVAEGTRIDEAVLLDEAGALTDAAYEVACEYASEVFATLDPSVEWLPKWSWMRAEQVERGVFGQLLEAGGENAYVAARRFLIDMPAGAEWEVVDERERRHVPRVAAYQPVPSSHRLGGADGGWWWPCPVCRWPMRVEGVTVRCLYRPHRALYSLAMSGGAPRLVARGVPMSVEGRGDKHLRHPPAARLSATAVCVDPSVWRYIVVPGAAEVRLHDILQAIRGVAVRLWPDRDLYDLRVTVGERVWKVDLKEYASLERLLTKLRVSPPAGGVAVVLPDSHAGQRAAVRVALPGRQVLLASELLRHVRRAARTTRVSERDG